MFKIGDIIYDTSYEPYETKCEIKNISLWSYAVYHYGAKKVFSLRKEDVHKDFALMPEDGNDIIKGML